MSGADTLPTVSVIIPCYNAGAYLARVLDAVFAQTYPAKLIEIAIVDDGSTDNSHEIALRYADRDDRIQVLHQANAGVGAARNRGIRATEGELVAFLDADDIWVPTKLSEQVAVYQADPEVGLIHCGCRFVDANGDALSNYSRTSRTDAGDILLEYFCDFFLITSAVVVPRRCLDKVGLFEVRDNLAMAEDHDLFLRLLTHYRAGCAPAPLLNRTVRADSLSRLDYDLDASCDLRLLKQYLIDYPHFARRHRRRTRARIAAYLFTYGWHLVERGDRASARTLLCDSLLTLPSLAALRTLVKSLLPAGAVARLRPARR